MPDIAAKFHDLESVLNSFLLERHNEIHTSSLALIGRQHHFSLGVPGIAKSLLVDETVKRISGVRLFDALLTRITKGEEILGAPNIKDLAETGLVKRVTTGMLPEADVVFLDEIFKCSPAILNALLKALNERKFVVSGGNAVDIPLHTAYGASNELAESEELNALWDRLHFRVHSSPLFELGSFARLLRMDMDPDPQPVLTFDEIRVAHIAASQVVIPDEIIDAYIELKQGLAAEGVTVTDRRWRESVKAVKSEAFFNGRTTARIEDMKPLMHFLWESPESIKPVTRVVLGLSSPIEKEANENMEDLRESFRQYCEAKTSDLPASQISNAAVEMWKKIGRNKDAYKELAGRATEQSNILDAYKALITETNQTLTADLRKFKSGK